ncbi:MAG TPA: hypothetical protein VL728_02160 [Cyclobacteriaceae bacterium]|jgi:hypothetical protein|nr:hypothetical protein [Cyclobacteriaceae bacterium]
MSKKIVYLFLALLLPALIFVFLKYFGKNEFDIPILYPDGVPEIASECRPASAGQYFVPDSVLAKRNWNGASVLFICAGEKEGIDLRQRLAEAKFEVQIIEFDRSETKLKNCALVMNDPWDAVLIDDQRRIRDYYKLGHRDEMDRLEVELKILLKKY